MLVSKIKKISIFFFLLLFLVGFIFPLSTKAAVPTIEISRYGESKNYQTGKWMWWLKIKTTNVPNGTPVHTILYKTTGENIRETTEKILYNNTVFSTLSILDSKTTYFVTVTIPSLGNVTKTYSNTTPASWENSSNPMPPPVPLPPNTTEQTKSVDTKTTYTPLAPLPDGTGQLMGEFDTKPSDTNPCPFGKYLNIVIKFFIGMAAVLSMIMIVMGGIEYMTSDLVSSKESGKSKIRNAVLGLLLALGSYTILNTLNPKLLDVCLNNLPEAKITIDAESETTPWTGTSEITGTTTLCTEGYTNVSTYGQPKKINVCKSISSNLQKMLDKAKEENIILSGSGSRTYNEQVALRRKNNCPDIYNSPSKDCHPETARPGHSKHESGKAVDFTCNGKSMEVSGGKSSPCFIWLTKNAWNYGRLKNLASESWHWSDDGR